MSEVPTGRDDGAKQYEICIKGHLAPRWAAWFDGMTLTPNDDGTTVIHGTVADQSALHGLLGKLNDLGVPLLSVTPTRPNEPAEDLATEPHSPIQIGLTHSTRRSTT